MSRYAIISDGPAQGYTEWMAEALEAMSGRQVSGIALVAFIDGDPAMEAMTGYWHCGCVRKGYAATHIQSDATLDLVRINFVDDEDEDGADE